MVIHVYMWQVMCEIHGTVSLASNHPLAPPYRNLTAVRGLVNGGEAHKSDHDCGSGDHQPGLPLSTESLRVDAESNSTGSRHKRHAHGWSPREALTSVCSVDRFVRDDAALRQRDLWRNDEAVSVDADLRQFL